MRTVLVASVACCEGGDVEHRVRPAIPLAPQDRPATTGWRSIAARLMFAAVAAMLATQPVSAAGPGDDEIRIGNDGKRRVVLRRKIIRVTRTA